MQKSCLAALTILALTFFLFETDAYSGNIAEQYTLEGLNPDGRGKYAGVALVKRTGDIYTVGWKIGDQEHIGTGLVQGDFFAVVYLPRNGKASPGLVVYTIMADGELVGTYTTFGGTTVGKEVWKPVLSK